MGGLVETASGGDRAPAPAYDVFLSHKSEYKRWVEWLGRALERSGRSVFLDSWRLVPGKDWVEGLHRGLDGSRSAILVATPEVVNSGWVREEYTTLVRRCKANPAFVLVPVVFGAIPNLPFLSNLQAVDCRDPDRYREWFQRILCGLDGRAPGPDPRFGGDLEPPPSLAAPRASDVVPSEEGFVGGLMRRVARPQCPPLILSARGRRFQGPVIQALRERALQAYGSSGLIHVTPPFSEQASPEAGFAELSRQCGLPRVATDATTFTSEFEELLDERGLIFLLVTGFENAGAACRKELAGALRTLGEHRLDSFRVVLLGGQRLMEQKYAGGSLSFLSHAVVEEWPPPSIGDVVRWQRTEFPSVAMSEEDAQRLLEVSGGHAGLVRYCLERRDSEGGTPRWEEWCRECPELWETWYRLSRELDVERLRRMLEAESFGPAVAWPPDATERELYWADLLCKRGERLGWHAEVVRQVGRGVLA